MIDAERNLESIGNIIWVTNRQQGKTSTLATIACLALHPVGGDLVAIYATSLDRANSSASAKVYVKWMLDKPTMAHAITKNNNTTWVLSNGVASNMVFARPKNPDRQAAFTFAHVIRAAIARGTLTDSFSSSVLPKSFFSCRGDAPHCCFFDEAVFVCVCACVCGKPCSLVT